MRRLCVLMAYGETDHEAQALLTEFTRGLRSWAGPVAEGKLGRWT